MFLHFTSECFRTTGVEPGAARGVVKRANGDSTKGECEDDSDDFTVVSGECSEVGGSEGVASLKVGGQNLAEFDLVAGAQGVKLGFAAIEQVHIGVAGDAIDIATIATLPEGHVLPATWQFGGYFVLVGGEPQRIVFEVGGIAHLL